MELIDFFNRVEEHQDLEGVSIADEGIFHVEHTPTKLTTALPAAAIEDPSVTWELVESVLVGEREPKVLYHMTRVVGYYSRVDNWNQSKVGELKDRQKGNYSIAQ